MLPEILKQKLTDALINNIDYLNPINTLQLLQALHNMEFLWNNIAPLLQNSISEFIDKNLNKYSIFDSVKTLSILVRMKFNDSNILTKLENKSLSENKKVDAEATPPTVRVPVASSLTN